MGGLVEAAVVDELEATRPALGFRGTCNSAEGETEAGEVHGAPEHPSIAEHDGNTALGRRRPGKRLDDDLRADAGRVPHRHRNARAFVHSTTLRPGGQTGARRLPTTRDRHDAAPRRTAETRRETCRETCR